MKTIREEAREIPVAYECDVLVVGGGTAGCAAAVCAARNGAKVILMEQLPTLCGTFGNGGVVANSFYSTYVGPEYPIRKVVKGFAEELFEELKAHNGTTGYIFDPKPEKNPYHRPVVAVVDHEIPKVVLAQMLRKAGVKVLLHSFLSDVRTEDGRVTGVIFESKSGRRAIEAKAYVDCTGDGDLAIMAGAPWEPLYNGYRYAGNLGLMFGVEWIDMQKFYRYASERGLITENNSWSNEGLPKDGMTRLRVDFRNDAELFEKLRARRMWPGMTIISMHKNAATHINMLGRNGIDVNDVDLLSEAEMDLRQDAMFAVELFREFLPGFEDDHLSYLAPKVGIRGSRTIHCDYSLTNDEIVNSARFEDEVGVFGFQDLAPIGDKWMMKNKGAYGLPYRMLLPQGLSNVWAAGRHVTVGVEAQMSTRNTISCMVQGQAAGTAAALCASLGCDSRALPYEKLRETLLKDNVYLGE